MNYVDILLELGYSGNTLFQAHCSAHWEITKINLIRTLAQFFVSNIFNYLVYNTYLHIRVLQKQFLFLRIDQLIDKHQL